MGFRDLFKTISGSDDDYDDYYDEDEEDDLPEERPSRKVSRFRTREEMEEENARESRSRSERDRERERERSPRSSAGTGSSSAGVRSSKKPMIPAGREVCVIKPTQVEDEMEIAQTLLSNRTVVLNLEGLDFSVAQRILDFASGACYAIDGKLHNISRYIFVITPAAVDISGDVPTSLSLTDSGALNTGSMGGSALNIPLGQN